MTGPATAAPPGASGPSPAGATGGTAAGRPRGTAARRAGRVGGAGRVSRRPLVVLTAVLAVDHADRYLLSAVFPLLQAEFGLSDARLGTLSAAFLLVVTIGAVPSGVLVDRTVRVKLAAWGAALWSVAMVLTGLASSYSMLFLSRMGLGVAEASYGPASFSLLTDYYPVEERSRVLGLNQLGAIIGFIGLPLGGLVATTWGWRAAFHVYALPGFVLAVLAWRLPEPDRGRADRVAAGLAAPPPGSVYSGLSTGASFALLLRTRTVTISLLTQSLAVFFTSGLGIWSTTFLVREHHLSLPQATAATSLLAIGAVAGTLLGGRLGDALLLRGIPTGQVRVAATGQVLGVLLLVPAFAVRSTPLMLVLFAFGAVTLTLPNAPLAALRASVVHPDLRGRAASVGAVLTAAAAASSPLVIGLLSDAIGLRQALLAVLPLMGVGGILMAAFGARAVVPDTRRMQKALLGSSP